MLSCKRILAFPIRLYMLMGMKKDGRPAGLPFPAKVPDQEKVLPGWSGGMDKNLYGLRHSW